nr:uncharacterized protein LOC109181091 [Ipomoea batatas]
MIRQFLPIRLLPKFLGGRRKLCEAMIARLLVMRFPSTLVAIVSQGHGKEVAFMAAPASGEGGRPLVDGHDTVRRSQKRTPVSSDGCDSAKVAAMAAQWEERSRVLVGVGEQRSPAESKGMRTPPLPVVASSPALVYAMIDHAANSGLVGLLDAGNDGRHLAGVRSNPKPHAPVEAVPALAVGSLSPQAREVVSKVGDVGCSSTMSAGRRPEGLLPAVEGVDLAQGPVFAGDRGGVAVGKPAKVASLVSRSKHRKRFNEGGGSGGVKPGPFGLNIASKPGKVSFSKFRSVHHRIGSKGLSVGSVFAKHGAQNGVKSSIGHLVSSRNVAPSFMPFGGSKFTAKVGHKTGNNNAHKPNYVANASIDRLNGLVFPSTSIRHKPGFAGNNTQSTAPKLHGSNGPVVTGVGAHMQNHMRDQLNHGPTPMVNFHGAQNGVKSSVGHLVSSRNVAPSSMPFGGSKFTAKVGHKTGNNNAHKPNYVANASIDRLNGLAFPSTSIRHKPGFAGNNTQSTAPKLHGSNGPVVTGASGGGVAKSQPPGPVPAPQAQVVRQPIAQGQAVSTGVKELALPAQGAAEAPFNFEIIMQGLNAKQRKRLIRKLKKQKGKSVVVDKSPEGETSGVQPGIATVTRGVQALQSVPTSNAFALLRQEGAKGPLTGPASQLSPIPKASEQAPTPASSIQADVSRPQQVSFSFTPFNPARFMGPLELGTPPCTPPSDRASGDTREVSPVVPGGPRRTVGRSYSDSDVPRAGQEADLEGSGFETDQELYLDQSSVPVAASRVTLKRGAPLAQHVPGSGGYS